MKQAIKLNSFKALATVVHPEKTNSDKWLEFLTKKGHTPQTFSYLPENLKLALQFSFAKQ